MRDHLEPCVKVVRKGNADRGSVPIVGEIVERKSSQSMPPRPPKNPSNDAKGEISRGNVKRIEGMDEHEILAEQEHLKKTLPPRLLAQKK